MWPTVRKQYTFMLKIKCSFVYLATQHGPCLQLGQLHGPWESLIINILWKCSVCQHQLYFASLKKYIVFSELHGHKLPPLGESVKKQVCICTYIHALMTPFVLLVICKRSFHYTNSIIDLSRSTRRTRLNSIIINFKVLSWDRQLVHVNFLSWG